MQSQNAVDCRRFSGNWWKAKLKNVGLSIVAALVLALVIRSTVAEDFYAATDAVAPEIHKSNHLLVYKLASEYSAGDIIVYRKADNRSLLGRVTSADPATGKLTIERNNESPETVTLSNVVGRVVLNSR